MLEQQATQNPLTVSMLNAQAQQVNKPLRDNVKQALRNYLSQLNGEDPTELYELVLSEIEHPMLDMVMQYTPVTKPVRRLCLASTVEHYVKN